MYDIFMIDPPWDLQKIERKVRPNQKKELDYQTLNIKKIFRLLDKKILSKANSIHVVFLWVIEKYLHEAEEEMLKRGYKRHCRFIWDKTNGVAACHTIRFSHEYLIWFYKPKMIKIHKKARGKYTTVFTERSRQHSRKPNIAYRMINDFYPHHKKIDVFSREGRLGWDQFGDEINKFTIKRKANLIPLFEE
jgi:N6-adenosine-specific RNA methylase IME4